MDTGRQLYSQEGGACLANCHAASTALTVTDGLRHHELQLLRRFYNPLSQSSWNYINFCTVPVTQLEKVSSWVFYKSV